MHNFSSFEIDDMRMHFAHEIFLRCVVVTKGCVLMRACEGAYMEWLRVLCLFVARVSHMTSSSIKFMPFCVCMSTHTLSCQAGPMFK